MPRRKGPAPDFNARLCFFIPWEVLRDDTLRAIARQLVETVRSNVTIDWTLRENVRANLRVLVRRILRKHSYPPASRAEAEHLRTVFTSWCRDHSYEAAAEALERDWDRMVTFYDFPKEHWRHIRTTNPVESPFAALRLRTDAAKRYKRVDRAIAVIWKMLMIAEQRFRRLKAPELMEDVYLSRQICRRNRR